MFFSGNTLKLNISMISPISRKKESQLQSVIRGGAEIEFEYLP